MVRLPNNAETETAGRRARRAPTWDDNMSRFNSTGASRIVPRQQHVQSRHSYRGGGPLEQFFSGALLIVTAAVATISLVWLLGLMVEASWLAFPYRLIR